MRTIFDYIELELGEPSVFSATRERQMIAQLFPHSGSLEEPEPASSAEVLPTLNSFTMDGVEKLQRYFELQRPQEQLDKLKEILDQFYKELIGKFDVTDLITKVGARDLSLASTRPAH